MRSYLGLALLLAAMAIGAALAGLALSGVHVNLLIGLSSFVCMAALVAAGLTLLNR